VAVVVVTVLVIAVVGAATFVTKVVWFTLMAEMWKKPPQLRQGPHDSTKREAKAERR
jgi:hypothetical protein